jgi:hypothetical protein
VREPVRRQRLLFRFVMLSIIDRVLFFFHLSSVIPLLALIVPLFFKLDLETRLFVCLFLDPFPCASGS